MPRKKVIIKRELPPDPQFNNVLVSRFVSSVMHGGKKSTAEGIVYDSLNILQTKTGLIPNHSHSFIFSKNSSLSM